MCTVPLVIHHICCFKAVESFFTIFYYLYSVVEFYTHEPFFHFFLHKFLLINGQTEVLKTFLGLEKYFGLENFFQRFDGELYERFIL